MGVDASGAFGYGCIFDKDSVWKVCQELFKKNTIGKYKTIEEIIEDCCFYEMVEMMIGYEADDSVDFYSGQDWDKHIYVYLKRVNATNTVNVFEKASFYCSDEEISKFLQDLQSKGLDKPVETGYIFRTYFD